MKPPLTATPTLADLIRDPTRITALPPKAVAMLAAGVVYATLSERAGTDHSRERTDEGEGEWVGVGEAARRTSYPRRWFFRRRELPFCRSLSRKQLLVNLAKLERMVAHGDVALPQKRQSTIGR